MNERFKYKGAKKIIGVKNEKYKYKEHLRGCSWVKSRNREQ